MDEELALEQYFSDLNEAQMRHLVAAAKYETFNSGKTLATQGESGDRAFIILEGEIEVILSDEGRERLLGRRGQGHILGEMALLEDEPRAATLRTISDVKALVLTRNGFHGLLKAQPEMALAINRMLSARMRRTQKQLVEELNQRVSELETQLAEKTSQLEAAQKLLGQDLT